MNPVALPVQDFARDADTLFRWLGLFWSSLYEDPDFLKRAQGARAIGVAQVYLDLLETAQLLDRNRMPVLHRERWYPIVIRRSQRDTGGVARLRFGMQPAPVFGPQEGGDFPSGSKFAFGAGASFAGVFTYPLPEPAVSVVCVVDNIAAPTTVLVRDRDFTLQDGSIVLRRGDDPFTGTSAFAVSEDGDDAEAVLWGCDVMFDKDFVYQHAGAILGVNTPSTEHFKRAINAVWDLVNCGASPRLLTTGLAAICGVPVCLSDGETVEAIATFEHATTVITSTGTYDIRPEARLAVAVGDVLAQGQPLTTGIRVYGPLTAAALSQPSLLRTDMPALPLTPEFFAVPLAYGLSAGWDPAPIKCAGTDANGNPRLWFPLQGAETDVRAFWGEVWRRAEAAGVSLQACFQDHISDTVTGNTEAVWGYVEPLDFMLRNLVGSNTVFVALDTDALGVGEARTLLPAFVALLRKTLPAYARLFVVQRKFVGPDGYYMEESTTTDTVRLTVSLSAASQGSEGGPRQSRMTFKDRPLVKRWVAV